MSLNRVGASPEKGILTLKITCFMGFAGLQSIDIGKMGMAFRGAILRSFFSLINYICLNF